MADLLSAAARAAAARRLDPTPIATPAALTSLRPRRGARVVVLAGPGVLRASAAPGVRTLAAITGATVLNTVGAKGLLPWDDPLHGGTVGLQEGDVALAEILTADLLVTTGLDPTESVSLTAAVAARADADPDGVVEVHPAHLHLAAGGWPPAAAVGPRPEVYAAIASVVGPMYAAPPDRDGRVAPPAAARALATGLLEGGLVVTPPGPTGFWIGRTFPTAVPGSVVVTTGDPAGTAEALALGAARRGRPVTLVVPASEPGEIASLGEVVAAERLRLSIEVWAGDGDPVHELLHVHTIPVDRSALDPLVALAGRPDPAIWPDAPPAG